MRLFLSDLRLMIEARLPMTTSAPRTFTTYRVEETRQAAERLLGLFQEHRLGRTGVGIPGLFVTDNPTDWTGDCIIVMKASVVNPLVLKNDAKSLEQRIGPTDRWLDSLREQGYDSVVSVPANSIIGARQMLLFDPNTQVLSMKIVDR